MDQGGMGLGLTISKQILHKLGGSMNMFSAEG